jgi:glutamate synthase (NADPH/NADH) small chain
MGAEQPRDLEVPGRELEGVEFAMDFLTQQNRRVAGDRVDASEAILATGKHVVVLGGGDTGSDCIGTSHRQGAKSVTSLELLPQPPEGRHASEPWPQAKRILLQRVELACRRRRASLRVDDQGAARREVA